MIGFLGEILRLFWIVPALAGAAPGAAIAAAPVAEPCRIEMITHETREDRTRVIIRASAPIAYRGGRLIGDQIVLDLANVEWALPSPVVDLLSPEVTRVIAGPEITKDGENLLKLRLTGVRASRHKVLIRGREIHIDLTVKDPSRPRPRGLPKVIRNDSGTMT